MHRPIGARPPEVRPGALLPEDVAACRASLARHSKTFHAASLLLPPRVRDAATVLYGFCRLADDAVDVEGGQHRAIASLRDRLARVYAGQPRAVSADRALAAVVAQHAIPRELPEFLIEGLAWDAQGRCYESFDELLDYAARVAGAVGAMMSLLMGTRDPQALARACDLGVAMQLSNIARDVGEDARMGRLYLPRAWMREAGLDPVAWLAAPRHEAALAGVVARLLAEAEALYARAGAGIARLPLGCRPGIGAARLLYADLGRQIARAGHDAVRRRAVVPGRRKAWLLLRAAVSVRPSSAGLADAPLACNQPLIDAVAAGPAPAAEPVKGAVPFVLDLFERLERRDRMHGGWA